MLNYIEKLAKWGFIVLVISLCLIPFLSLSRYVQPQYDDYSVWLVFQKFNFFEAQKVWYTTWTGRYTEHLMMSLFHPIIYGQNDLISIVAIAAILIFPFSIFYAIKRIIPEHTSLIRILPIFSCLLLIYYWQLPSPAEAFYWIPSIFAYQFGIIYMCFFFGILWNSSGEYSKIEKIILIVLAIFIPGTCEIALLIFLSGLGCTILLKLINERKLDRFLMTLGVICLSFSLFSIMSPGNTVRTSVLQQIENTQPGNISFTIKAAIQIIKEQLLTLFIRSPFLLLSILFAWLFSNLNIEPWRKFRYIYIPIYIAIWTSVYFFLHLPFIYKAGIVHIPGRVLNITQFYFIAGWFGLIAILIRTYGNKQPSNTIFASLILVISSVYILVQLIMPNKIQSAIRDWLSGDAANYEAQLEERYEYLNANKGLDVVVKPIENLPFTIFIAEITPDSLTDRNLMVKEYFKLKSLRTDSSLIEQ